MLFCVWLAVFTVESGDRLTGSTVIWANQSAVGQDGALIRNDGAFWGEKKQKKEL